jgi:hypothetical protein
MMEIFGVESALRSIIINPGRRLIAGQLQAHRAVALLQPLPFLDFKIQLCDSIQGRVTLRFCMRFSSGMLWPRPCTVFWLLSMLNLAIDHLDKQIGRESV